MIISDMFRFSFKAIFRLMAYQRRDICVTVRPRSTSNYIYFNFHILYILHHYIKYTVDHDSSVGIATAYGLDGPGIESRWGARFSAPVQTG